MAATDTETAKQTVTHFMEVFSSGDVDATMDLMTEDATWWVAGTVPGLSGTHNKEEFRQLLGGVADGCNTPITLTPKEFTVEGNRVAIETESYAEVKNGRTYQNQYHFLFVLEGDKVKRVKEYLDTMHTKAVFVD